MENTFDEVSEVYAGMNMINDYERVGNEILKRYGLKMAFGDHQFMIRFAYRPMLSDEELEGLHRDMVSEEMPDAEIEAELSVLNPMYDAWVCVCFEEDKPGNQIIDVHLEHGFEGTNHFDPYFTDEHCLTDEEYDRGIEIVEAVLNAVVE